MPAKADIFDRLSGSFGVPDLPEESCAENPAFSHFTADRSRVTFSWVRPVVSYTGAMITSYGGTVVATAPDSITMRRDNETRRDPSGALVLWIMRATPEGYCWTRSDWPPDECLPTVRCGSEANS
ncbi:hypothetical protein [Stagnihabitans tardus]|uniref:Uncharacterized protein n=1 Tax=Stagnihabitans tardus TaxID=2699202 RepID=A0AAE4Y7H1_9RHOB|nr:hypothetical protein [Stagnihabitans tardus]NBZ86574.1 hypothetical protein [Stagnihabitans tardus]